MQNKKPPFLVSRERREGFGLEGEMDDDLIITTAESSDIVCQLFGIRCCESGFCSRAHGRDSTDPVNGAPKQDRAGSKVSKRTGPQKDEHVGMSERQGSRENVRSIAAPSNTPFDSSFFRPKV